MTMTESVDLLEKNQHVKMRQFTSWKLFFLQLSSSSSSSSSLSLSLLIAADPVFFFFFSAGAKYLGSSPTANNAARLPASWLLAREKRRGVNNADFSIGRLAGAELLSPVFHAAGCDLYLDPPRTVFTDVLWPCMINAAALACLCRRQRR